MGPLCHPWERFLFFTTDDMVVPRMEETGLNDMTLTDLLGLTLYSNGKRFEQAGNVPFTIGEFVEPHTNFVEQR